MEAVTPSAGIDVSKGAPPERIDTRHAADEGIYPKEGYLGLNYTVDLIVIQITWVGGRSSEVKKRFYKRIAHEIHEQTGVQKEDVWINLVDDAKGRLVFRQPRDAIRAKMRLRNVSGEV
jgi:hypothetical protein